MMKIAILFDSHTGNTESIAKSILNACNNEDVAYFGSPKIIDNADIYFIGSWVDKGNLSKPIIDYVKTLKHKNIAFFATCGFGGSKQYFKMLEKNFDDNVNSSNTIMGHFICQGKMPLTVKERYLKMLKANPEDKSLQQSLENFESALCHPNDIDLNNAKQFANDVIAKI